jgi:histidyl-tRNA synthetase
VKKIHAPKGTNDIFPPDSAAWNVLETNAREIAQRFGYGEIRTPMFEETELFVRGVGETTDIVEKEMWNLFDKDTPPRSFTLRPEWTAPVVRAALQHALLDRGPLRLFYVGPFFRYERPQAGRYRQANQFGVECFGFAGAEADVEVMQIASALVERYGIADAHLQINSIGDAVCRPAYRDALLAHFRPHAAALSEDSQRRLERNPLRILDSKAPQDAALIASAPTFVDTLCPACAEHFALVRSYLDAIGIAYSVNPRLVRGFDYYTRTVFEITSSALGSQSALCGGGRYDGLVASLGGPATPAVGFGLGLERFLMVVNATAGETAAPRRGFQAIALGEAAKVRLIPLVAALRRVGEAPVFMDFRKRKLFDHFATADRNGARYGIILGDDELAKGEVVLRDLVARDERRLAFHAGAEETARVLVEASREGP